MLDTTSPLERISARPVPAVVRVVRIVDAIARGDRPQGVSELARDLELPRSSVHGVCRTLVELGVLSRRSNGFEVGPHVLVWANAFQSQNSLTKAFGSLAESVDSTHAINLSVLSGTEVLYVGCRVGSDPIGVRFREGLRFPAPFTATGKAMLSTLPDDELTELFAGRWPESLTPSSITSVDVLREELAEVRARGYSLDTGQLREVMVCCGAPVFAAGSRDRAVAGVAIAMVAVRATADNVRTTGERVRAFAAELSRRLGA